MNKTIGAIFEKYVGIISGAIAFLFACKYRANIPGDSINIGLFLDKIIDITAIFFGFFLTVLTLIIQGNSSIIKKMREYGSFIRLVSFNKKVVLLSGFISLYSLVLILFYGENIKYLCIPITIDIGLACWLVIDGLIFLRIFYLLITEDAKRETGL